MGQQRGSGDGMRSSASVLRKTTLSSRERSTLKYPAGSMTPTDFLRFIQMDAFVKDWDRLDLDDDDLRALEVLIMIDPNRYPVIPGTGGLRKLRFSSNRWDKGKQSGIRVCYAHFPASSVAVLFVAYAKNEIDDLSAAQRTQIARAIKWCEQGLSKGD